MSQRERYEAVRAAFDAIARVGDPYRVDIQQIVLDAFDAGMRAAVDTETDAGMWQTLVAQLPDRRGKVTRYFRRHPVMSFGALPIDGAFVQMEEVEQREFTIRWLDVNGTAPTLDHVLREERKRARKPA
jgi:hypothetical protein